MRNTFNSLSFRFVTCASVAVLIGLSAATASAGYPYAAQPNYPNNPPIHNPVGYNPNTPDDYAPPPVCRYKEVVVYQSRQIPEVRWVTKCDSYGHPIQVKVVTYRTIQVPVHKLVKVCY